MLESIANNNLIAGLDDVSRARLVGGLNRSLVSLMDLAAAYQHVRWNVVGPDFSQLHPLFDGLADQIRADMDVLAERAVTLGGVASGTIQSAVERTPLSPFPVQERDAVRLLELLVERTDELDSLLRSFMSEAADEPATQDVYVDVVRSIEKQRWMLEAHRSRSDTRSRTMSPGEVIYFDRTLPTEVFSFDPTGQRDVFAFDPDEWDPEVPSPDIAADKVLLASWESFPASDSPGWR